MVALSTATKNPFCPTSPAWFKLKGFTFFAGVFKCPARYWSLGVFGAVTDFCPVFFMVFEFTNHGFASLMICAANRVSSLLARRSNTGL